MSLTTANLYYVVKHDMYEKCRIKQNEVDEKLSAYPKRVVKKIKTLLTFLSAGGVTWDLLGYCTSYTPELNPSWSVLEYSTYAVLGKGDEPPNFIQYLLLVIRLKATRDLFCTKVQKKIIRQEKKIIKSQKKDA